MNVIAVESTTLAALAYDHASQTLQLEFRNRTIYRYFGVPAEVHQALLLASSKGSYFNRVVRGNFPYYLVSDAPSGVSSGALEKGSRR